MGGPWRKDIPDLMRKKAAAVITFDENGLPVEQPSLRPENIGMSHLNLILLEEEGRGGERTLIAEIGLGRRDPYRRTGPRSLELSQRRYARTLSQKQVVGILPTLCSLLAELTVLREPHWRSPAKTNWYDFFWRGACISVDARDEGLVRAFTELELLNPSFYWRARRISKHLARRGRVRGGDGFPAGFWNFKRVLLSSSRGPYLAPWLRGHALAELVSRIPSHPSFCVFLQEQQLARGDDIAQAMRADARKNGGRALPFEVLPDEAKQWNVIDSNQGLPVFFQAKRGSSWTITVMTRRSRWLERRAEVLASQEPLPLWAADDDVPDWVRETEGEAR